MGKGLVLCFLTNRSSPAYSIVGQPGKAPDAVRIIMNLHPPSAAQGVQYVSGLMQWRSCVIEQIWRPRILGGIKKMIDDRKAMMFTLICH